MSAVLHAFFGLLTPGRLMGLGLFYLWGSVYVALAFTAWRINR